MPFIFFLWCSDTKKRSDLKWAHSVVSESPHPRSPSSVIVCSRTATDIYGRCHNQRHSLWPTSLKNCIVYICPIRMHIHQLTSGELSHCLGPIHNSRVSPFTSLQHLLMLKTSLKIVIEIICRWTLNECIVFVSGRMQKTHICSAVESASYYYLIQSSPTSGVQGVTAETLYPERFSNKSVQIYEILCKYPEVKLSNLPVKGWTAVPSLSWWWWWTFFFTV